MGASRREEHGEVERFHMARSVAGRRLMWTSVYRVGDVLVDSGCSAGRAAFVPWLRERPVRAVLATHEHEDHIGNHAVLPRDAERWAPRLACEFLERGHPRFPLYRRIVWGYHEAAPGARVVGDKVDAGGRSFRVVRTNGHSADHVAYLDERENALFGGDAYMGKFKAARLAEDVITEIASLRRMAELDPAALFPAHGPVLPRPRARLVETAEHFEDLWRRAWRLRDAGADARAIRRELFPREPALTYLSGGEFSCANMVTNLLRTRPA
ncbi:MAG TPA: MBL fold metallo-hydrolase [Candidatus Thermoplasmatota archaeon]|nr:MBL fold metallo-hydrolase [Candidatus Thermoplasmatota archaeon]